MSHIAAKELQLDIEPCDTHFRGIGPPEPIIPLGKVTAKWYFVNTAGRRVFEDTFYVIEDDDFDVLLASKFIWKNEMFKRVLPH
jgi:hypothetical protein